MRSRLTAEQMTWLLSLASVPVFVWAARHMGWPVALVPLVVPVLLAMVRIPWLGYVAVTVAVASAFWVYAYPQVSVFSHGVFLSEVVLLMGLVAVCIRALRKDEQSPGSIGGIGVALIVYLLACMGGVIVGRAEGVSTTLAISSARAMVFFFSYWLAVSAFARPQWRTSVLRCMAVIAVLVVVLQAAQIIVGSSHHLFLIGTYTTQIVMQGGFLRVRPPGLTLVYVTAVFAASYLLWGPEERRRSAWWLLGVTVLGIILSLNRNMILGFILALTVTAIVGRRRSRVVTVIATVVTLAIAVVGVAVAFTGLTGTSSAVVQRVISIGNVQGLESGTLEVRYSENQLARRTLAAHPILGVGWGASYGATLEVQSGWRYVQETRPWIHNQYYGAWLRTGITGLVALLAALVLTALSGIRVLRRSTADAWLGHALVAAIVALSASAAVGMYFSEPASIVPLVGVMGLATVLGREPGDDGAER